MISIRNGERVLSISVCTKNGFVRGVDYFLDTGLIVRWMKWAGNS